jgi:hypothetical protein
MELPKFEMRALFTALARTVTGSASRKRSAS